MTEITYRNGHKFIKEEGKPLRVFKKSRGLQYDWLAPMFEESFYNLEKGLYCWGKYIKKDLVYKETWVELK